MPSQNRRTFQALVFVAFCLALLGVLAIGGETWAQGPGSTGTAGTGGTSTTGGTTTAVTLPCIIGPNGAICTSLPGEFNVTFPTGSGPVGSIVAIDTGYCALQVPVTGTRVSVLTASYVAVGHFWHLGVTAPNGSAVTGTLTPTAEVAIRFTAAELAAVSASVPGLVIMTYDAATGAWTPLQTISVDPAAPGTIRARLNYVGSCPVIGLFYKAPGTGGGGLDALLGSFSQWLSGLLP